MTAFPPPKLIYFDEKGGRHTRHELFMDFGISWFDEEALTAETDQETAQRIYPHNHEVVRIAGRKAALLMSSLNQPDNGGACIVKAVSNEFVSSYPRAPEWVQEIVDGLEWRARA